MTEVVIPEECQSIPSTQPSDWNQKGSLSLRNSSPAVLHHYRLDNRTAQQAHPPGKPLRHAPVMQREVCMSASSHFGKDRYPTGVVCSMDINKNAPSGLSSGRYDSTRHIPPSTAEMMIFLTSGFACMILFITFAPPRPKTRHREGRDFTATSRPLPTSHDGEVLEWLKRRAWKVRIPQKGIAGSNPALSAKR